MFGVAREQPVGFAGYGGEQYGNIRGVPDQVPARTDQNASRVGNQLGIRQLDEAAIVLDQLIGVERWQVFCVKEQIFLHFIANHLGQHQLADLCRA